MAEKTCLITGATSGIGRVAARELARQGMRVAVVGRSAEKGARTVAEVRAHAGHDRVEFLRCDLESLADVRALARTANERFPRIDVLILNAGVLEGRRRESADGFEVTFQVNHLSHFLLAQLLRDKLEQSAPTRVVVVSSEAHRGRPLDFEDLNGQRRYSAWTAYQRSKLANLLFTFELARRTAGTGITANALHPGFVRTSFAKNNGAIASAAMTALSALFGISAEEGARTTLHLASSPEVEGLTSAYFARCQPRVPSPAALDERAARRLWEVSEKWTGLG